MRFRTALTVAAIASVALAASGCSLASVSDEPASRSSPSAASPPSVPLPPATPNPDPAIANACAQAKPSLMRIAESHDVWVAAGDYSPASFDTHIAELFTEIQYTYDAAQHPDLVYAVTRLGAELASAVWAHHEASETAGVSDDGRLALTQEAITLGFDEILALCTPEG